jgi:hypothetical protein
MSFVERNAQKKIQNLEIQIKQLYDNVHSTKMICNKHVENMRETSRVKRKDGFYMFSVQRHNDSHGILIYKETQNDGLVVFYLFDPNGRNSVNVGYNLSIKYNKEYIVSNNMSPSIVWNDYVGHCALWCIIVIILWNSFEPKKRMTALQLFDTKMTEHFNVRRVFIDDIYNLILTGKDFDTQLETFEFIQKVKNRIQKLSIDFEIQ